MHLVLSLNDFCPCILSLVHVQIYNIYYPLWDQYTDSIVPPCICACFVLCVDLSGLISVNNLPHLVSTVCSQLCQSFSYGGY